MQWQHSCSPEDAKLFSLLVAKPTVWQHTTYTNTLDSQLHKNIKEVVKELLLETLR